MSQKWEVEPPSILPGMSKSEGSRKDGVYSSFSYGDGVPGFSTREHGITETYLVYE